MEDRLTELGIQLSEKSFGIRNEMIARAGTLCRKMGIKTRFKNSISGKDMWTGFRRPYPEIVLGKAEKLTGRISTCLM
jgi:hypothetical protein